MGRPPKQFVPPPPRRGQLELPIPREIVADRNAEKGGRSFYFFDFDDNVAFLSTPAFLFHTETGEEWRISSGEFAQIHRQVGQAGPYSNYRIDLCDRTGTFRCFRDQDISEVEKALGKRQAFVEDLAAALGHPDLHWKGPSWACFFHATANRRPVSVITARGHSPQTIRDGISLFVEHDYLPHEPNYLSIFPVTNPVTRASLVQEPNASISVAELKKRAIRRSVEDAIRVYGPSPFHRFGMSDDDPHNIELIVDEMSRLKRDFPEMSFFVIETKGGHSTKYEIFPDHREATACAAEDDVLALEQLDFKFDR